MREVEGKGKSVTVVDKLESGIKCLHSMSKEELLKFIKELTVNNKDDTSLKNGGLKGMEAKKQNNEEEKKPESEEEKKPEAEEKTKQENEEEKKPEDEKPKEEEKKKVAKQDLVEPESNPVLDALADIKAGIEAISQKLSATPEEAVLASKQAVTTSEEQGEEQEIKNEEEVELPKAPADDATVQGGEEAPSPPPETSEPASEVMEKIQKTQKVSTPRPAAGTFDIHKMKQSKEPALELLKAVATGTASLGDMTLQVNEDVRKAQREHVEKVIGRPS